VKIESRGHLSPQTSESPLPAGRAFVVQLRTQSGPTADLFVGRVEHIASGEAQRFASADELLGFMTKVLAPAEPSPGEPTASTEPKGNIG